MSKVRNFRQRGMIWAFDAVVDDPAAAATFSRRFFSAALDNELLLRPIGTHRLHDAALHPERRRDRHAGRAHPDRVRTGAAEMSKDLSNFACFVTGTDTEVGKTLISSAILHALGQLGVRAAGMKPVAAGADLM